MVMSILIMFNIITVDWRRGLFAVSPFDGRPVPRKITVRHCRHRPDFLCFSQNGKYNKSAKLPLATQGGWKIRFPFVVIT